MKNILLIGAGNIGSRHLQGLKKVPIPLNIEVVDPSADALKLAEERYYQIPSSIKHQIKFSNNTESISEKIDFAILATSSNVRREITEKLVNRSQVKYVLFEKLLFQKKEDYPAVEKLLKKKKIKAWVNCNMRATPFYADLKEKILSRKVHCIVNGSKYGFITNAIHFIDYIAFLSDGYNFTLDTHLLDKKPILSKRKDFLEFNGTLNVYFSNGCVGVFTCYPNGDAPIVVEIISPEIRAMANESDRKTYTFTSPESGWEEKKESLSFQSEITNIITKSILQKGTCQLTPYSQSAKLHLVLLEGLRKHLNNYSSKKYNYYPFT